MKIAHSATVNLSIEDMQAICAEAMINNWGIMANMEVVGVSQLDDGSFQVELFPKPEQQETKA